MLIPAPSSSHGFRRKTNRNVARIQNDILQFLDIQMSAYGSKDFCVNYSSISLFYPRDFLILQPGARLTIANGAHAWLSAKSHYHADASMANVAKMFQTQALPFFDATNSVGRLAEHLTREDWGSRHHLCLEIAFCEARLNRVGAARALANRAIELYREDGRAWCPEYIELSRRLISAIENNRLVAMFQHWIDHSFSTLGLSRVRP